MSIESYGDADRVFRRALVASALAYAIFHHLGLLPDGLGSGPRGTQWADWLDLAVPWLVLVPAAVALSAGHVTQRVWAVFGAGALAYASGHGIHLAANSVGNASPGPTTHLWDEVVGHYLARGRRAGRRAVAQLRSGPATAVNHSRWPGRACAARPMSAETTTAITG